MQQHKVGEWYVNNGMSVDSAPILIIKVDKELGKEYEDVLIVYRDKIIRSSWYAQELKLISKPHINHALYGSLIVSIWRYI